MRQLVAVAVLTLSLFALTALADDKPVALPDDKNGPPMPILPTATRIEVRLADGSSVKMMPTQSHLDVTTKFGKLSIPVSEIRTISFALRYPPGVAERIATASIRLGSDDFKQREDAAAELLGFQELAYPTLLKLARSTDKEIARRADEMLAVLRDKLSEEKLTIKTHDTISTDAFIVIGHIENTTLRARSPYFGETTLNLADLRGLRRASLEGVDKDLVIDLTKYGVPQNVWLNTGIELTRDTALEIRAFGESDLYPIGGERGAYRTGPLGSIQWGMSRDRKIPGKLLARVGERGKEFEIGDRYDGTPGAEGKLYLRVGGSPWHNVPAGEYRVKIVQK